MQLVTQNTLARQQGAATLVFALILVTISTLIILFAGNYGRLQDKAITNISRNYQAHEAAQAGLEYGINYFNTNNSTIKGIPVLGFIPAYSDSNTSNVTLANGSKYTITYSNPVAYNYDLILISSTGSSDDDSATRTVSQLVQFGSMLVNTPTAPLIAQDDISLGGNSQIINTHTSTTVQSGGSVSMSGSSSTITSSGPSSSSGNMQSDVEQNVPSISSLSADDFFAGYFGVAPAVVKSSVGHYFSNSGNTNYKSNLSGLNDTSIWIDQTSGTATLNGNMTIGSYANPVLLIIDGNAKINGNVTIYGYVFVLGNSSTDLTGNLTIIGGMGSTSEVDAKGSIQIIYSPATLGNLQNSGSMRYYAKVPGSWKDL